MRTVLRGFQTMLLALLLVVPAAARAGDFMDTRLTWVFGDDDVMHPAGEVVPDSPLPGIGDRKGYELFMDNLNSKTKGRENLTHVALYKKMPGFLEGLTTEAALVLKLDMGALMQNQAPRVSDVLMDDGTYLRAYYSWNAEDPTNNSVGVTFFPFDTERFRLGYLWDISWGGGNIFSTKRSGPAPGVKIDVNAKLDPNVQFNAYLGMKTAKVSQIKFLNTGSGDAEQITAQEMNYGALGGVGVDLFDLVRLDLGAGFFQQGTFDINGLDGRRVYTFGVTSRLAVHQGLPIGSSIDFMLYRNDPNVNVVDWWREKYTPGKFSWNASLEFNYLKQLLSTSNQYATTKLQPAYAGALQLKFKWDYLRASAVGLIRNVEYILQNVPSLSPFVAMPDEGVSTTMEFFAAATVDYYFEKVHLMPFFTFGAQLPASYRSGNNTQIIRDATRRDILEPGVTVAFGDPHSWIYQMRAGLQWDLSEFMSLIGAVQYVRDENRTHLVNVEGSDQPIRQFDTSSFNQLGFTLVARARF